MKRGSPLRRGKPLKRTAIEPSAIDRRAAGLKKKRNPKRNRNAIPPGVRHEVERRSRGMCETPGYSRDCGTLADHMHHRRRRGQGGSDRAENLLHLCAACHREIHDHPARAYERGYLLRSGS